MLKAHIHRNNLATADPGFKRFKNKRKLDPGNINLHELTGQNSNHFMDSKSTSKYNSALIEQFPITSGGLKSKDFNTVVVEDSQNMFPSSKPKSNNE